MSKQSEIMTEFMEANKKFNSIKKLDLPERVYYMNWFVGILEMILDLLPDEWAHLHIAISEKSMEEAEKLIKN